MKTMWDNEMYIRYQYVCNSFINNKSRCLGPRFLTPPFVCVFVCACEFDMVFSMLGRMIELATIFRYIWAYFYFRWFVVEEGSTPRCMQTIPIRLKSIGTVENIAVRNALCACVCVCECLSLCMCMFEYLCIFLSFSEGL